MEKILQIFKAVAQADSYKAAEPELPELEKISKLLGCLRYRYNVELTRGHLAIIELCEHCGEPMEKIAAYEAIKEGRIFYQAAIALCPVCGFGLGFVPWEDGKPSYQVCPCCNTVFGYDDDPQQRAMPMPHSYVELRDQWIREGCLWRGRPEKRPPNWDRIRQMREAGIPLSEIYD
jgi:hypothetical protein